MSYCSSIFVKEMLVLNFNLKHRYSLCLDITLLLFIPFSLSAVSYTWIKVLIKTHRYEVTLPTWSSVTIIIFKAHGNIISFDIREVPIPIKQQLSLLVQIFHDLRHHA